MSALHMTEAERTALNDARAGFSRYASPKSAAVLLRAAYEAWNEGHFDERDYVCESLKVTRWLERAAGIDDARAEIAATQERLALDCKSARETLAFGGGS